MSMSIGYFALGVGVTAEEILNNLSIIKKIKGFIWLCAVPVSISDYRGKLVKIEKKEEIYEIEFLIKAISRLAIGYRPRATERKLILLFKENNVRFYTSRQEAKKLFGEGLASLIKLVSEKTIEKMEKINSKSK